MEVSEVMTRSIIGINPDSSILQAAKKMVSNNISGLVVLNHGFQVKGIVTERDILKAFSKKMKYDTPVEKVMRKKVITVGHDETLEGAAGIMIKHKIKRLPVVQKGKCVGIVTATDLLKYEDHLLDRLAVLFLLPQKQTQAG